MFDNIVNEIMYRSFILGMMYAFIPKISKYALEKILALVIPKNKPSKEQVDFANNITDAEYFQLQKILVRVITISIIISAALIALLFLTLPENVASQAPVGIWNPMTGIGFGILILINIVSTIAISYTILMQIAANLYAAKKNLSANVILSYLNSSQPGVPRKEQQHFNGNKIMNWIFIISIITFTLSCIAIAYLAPIARAL